MAVPNPCVSARNDLGGGNYELVVLTVNASAWNFGVMSVVPIEPGPGGPAPDRDAPVAQATVTTNRISPNGDGRLDDVTVSSTFSEPTDWTLTVRPVTAGEETSAAVFTATGQRETSTNVTWDGRSMLADAGSIVADGTYRWELRGADASGNAMTPVTGTVIVDRTAPVLTSMKVAPNPVRLSRSATARIVFTPIEELSSPVTTRVTIRREGRVVRRFSPMVSDSGEITRLLWNLRNKNGHRVKAGRFRIVIVGTDTAFNTVINRGMVLRVRPRR